MNQKTALQRLWKDTCSVIVRVKSTDPITKITDFEEKPLFQDQPCKLSFETLTSNNGDNVATVQEKAKLFISTELTIPPGSKIIVTRQNRTFEFSQSGEPGIFTFHQEIVLEKFGRWA